MISIISMKVVSGSSGNIGSGKCIMLPLLILVGVEINTIREYFQM